MAYKDKDAQREYQRLWVAKRRAKFVSIAGDKCVKCGSTQDLEFDHRDRSTKVDHRIWSWAEKRIVAELEKCDLLCRKCHTEKSILEMDYPERQHGTNLMYLKASCRCEECKRAHAEVNSQYRRSC